MEIILIMLIMLKLLIIVCFAIIVDLLVIVLADYRIIYELNCNKPVIHVLSIQSILGKLPVVASGYT